jgi:hypothetical protein
MATMVALLDTLPTPSIDGVGKVYQQLKKHPRNRRHTAGGELLTILRQGLYFDPRLSQERGAEVTQGALEVGTTSSPARILVYDRLSRPGARLEPHVRRRHRPGDDDAQSQ